MSELAEATTWREAKAIASQAAAMNRDQARKWALANEQAMLAKQIIEEEIKKKEEGSWFGGLW